MMPCTRAQTPRAVPHQNAISPSSTHSRTGERNDRSNSDVNVAAETVLPTPDPTPKPAIPAAIDGAIAATSDTARATMPRVGERRSGGATGRAAAAGST
jgi:hypothetical protein